MPSGESRNRTTNEAASSPLFEVRDGEMEHTDHVPKHGGAFFMASDGWHHIECALTPLRELKIYMYDNYTKPHPGDHKATVQFAKTGEKLNASPVYLKTDNGYVLTLDLPKDLDLPVDVTARVAFANAPDNWMLFNAHFDTYSIDPLPVVLNFSPEMFSVVTGRNQTIDILNFFGANYIPNTPFVDDGRPRLEPRSFPFPEPIAYKPLPPFALIPRKLRVAPSGEVFED